MKKSVAVSLLSGLLLSMPVLSQPKAVGTVVGDGTVFSAGAVRATLGNNSPVLVGGVYEVVGNSSVFRMEDAVVVASKGTKMQVLGAGQVNLEKGSLQFKVSSKGKLTIGAGKVALLAGNIGIRPVSSSDFSSGIITKTESFINIRMLEGSANLLTPEGNRVLKAGESYTIKLAQAEVGAPAAAAAAGTTVAAVATVATVVATVAVAAATEEGAASPASP